MVAACSAFRIYRRFRHRKIRHPILAFRHIFVAQQDLNRQSDAVSDFDVRPCALLAVMA